MSVDTPPESEMPEVRVQPETPPALRREALLPSERSRGLGTVAVVCTMAGVASGLALATTLMAMQVADSMTVHTCPYRIVTTDITSVDVRADQGFLGVRYIVENGSAEVQKVLPGTPADLVGFHKGDHILSVDGAPIRTSDELTYRIESLAPGSQPTLTVERDGETFFVRPTLAPKPISITY